MTIENNNVCAQQGENRFGELSLKDVQNSIVAYQKKQDQKMNQLWAAIGGGASVGGALHHKHQGTSKADLSELRQFVVGGVLQKSLHSAETSGGYVMPYPVQEHINSEMMLSGSIRALARTSVISADALDVMTDADLGDVGWVSEIQSRDETKAPTLHRQKIHVHEVYAKPMVSQKVLDDAGSDIESWVVQHIAGVMMKTENTSFVMGDGKGKPKGFLSYPLVPVGQGQFGKIECVKTGKKGALDSLDVFYSVLEAMKPSYLEGAVWYMSRSAITKIRRLKTSDGLPIWQPSLMADQPDMLLGYPIVLSDDMPAVRDGEESASIVLANFKKGYQIVDRHDLRLMRDPYSSKPFVEFYATKRVGGDVIDFDAFKVIVFGE